MHLTGRALYEDQGGGRGATGVPRIMIHPLRPLRALIGHTTNPAAPASDEEDRVIVYIGE